MRRPLPLGPALRFEVSASPVYGAVEPLQKSINGPFWTRTAPPSRFRIRCSLRIQKSKPVAHFRSSEPLWGSPTPRFGAVPLSILGGLGPTLPSSYSPRHWLRNVRISSSVRLSNRLENGAIRPFPIWSSGCNMRASRCGGLPKKHWIESPTAASQNHDPVQPPRVPRQRLS